MSEEPEAGWDPFADTPEARFLSRFPLFETAVPPDWTLDRFRQSGFVVRHFHPKLEEMLLIAADNAERPDHPESLNIACYSVDELLKVNRYGLTKAAHTVKAIFGGEVHPDKRAEGD